MMLDIVKFYSIAHNGSHNGDIHFSREFVKHLMANIPAKRYIYVHDQSPRCLVDMPNLEYSGIEEKYQIFEHLTRRHNTLMINVWPFQLTLPELEKFFERNGDFLSFNYQYFSKIISKLNAINIPISPLGPPTDYIPRINYNYCEREKIDSFIKNDNNKIRVLVCNGYCKSRQIENFSFDRFIKSIAKKKITVITTDRTDIDNVCCTEDIIQIDNGDLNEISYLSRFCSIIIGRGSGPYCFCEVKENSNDPTKRFIGITDNISWAFWHRNPKTMRWTKDYSQENLLKIFNACLYEIGSIKLM